MDEAASPHDDTAQAKDRSMEAAIVAALGARPLVLVGMMGAGKSSIGRRLAARLGLPFMDADHEIERAAGMSIADIFAERGEPEFRDGEARVIARLLEAGPSVLATGGGAVMREETLKRIHEKSLSVWLKADAELILRRVRRRNDRPLLQTDNLEETVSHLLAAREPFYAQANVTVVSRDVPHEKIVEDCLAALGGALCVDGRSSSGMEVE